MKKIDTFDKNNKYALQFEIDDQKDGEKIGIRINANGNLELLKDENSQASLKNIEFSSYYKGQTKDRIYQKLHLDSKNPNFYEMASLTTYDKVWVVDTNFNPDEKLDGDTFAISCFFGFKVYRAQDNNICIDNCKVDLECFEIRNPNYNHKANTHYHPEKLGWYLIIEKITALELNAKDKIALITDHDCGRLKSFNSHKVPIFDNFFLPENFTFHYAKDKNKGVLGRLVNLCHKQSSELTEYIRSTRHVIKEQPHVTNSHLFSHTRHWKKPKHISLEYSFQSPEKLSGTMTLYGIKQDIE